MSEERIPHWRPKAWDDIEGHAALVGDAGQNFLNRVQYTVHLLCNHPELGGVFETTNPRLVGIRTKLVADFPRSVVFYRTQVREMGRTVGTVGDTALFWLTTISSFGPDADVCGFSGCSRQTWVLKDVTGD